MSHHHIVTTHQYENGVVQEQYGIHPIKVYDEYEYRWLCVSV